MTMPRAMRRLRIISGRLRRSGQAAWRLGVSIREYRELQARRTLAELRDVGPDLKWYGWPQTLQGSVRLRTAREVTLKRSVSQVTLHPRLCINVRPMFLDVVKNVDC